MSMSSSLTRLRLLDQEKIVKSTSGAQIEKAAFSEVVHALAQDMPVVMHGSGDVQPSEVNSDSVALLAELTANYISNLVEAAVDAHEILNDGPQPLPPPPLPKSRKTPIPTPPAVTTEPKANKTPNSGSTSTDTNGINSSEKRKKRRRATDEFWDEPLPEPKIKNKPTKPVETQGPKFQGVPVDEWVGVSGVDFWETNRARKAHVALPSAIGTQSFIFPVCHDAGLYGKVIEVQSARRSIAPLLADPVIQEVIRSEGTLQGPGALRKRDKKVAFKNEDEAAEPEVTDSEEEQDGGATWPGLDSLLPIHTTGDFSGL